MKLLLAALLVAYAAALTIDANNVEAFVTFRSFLQDHGKTYEEAEMGTRFGIFQENVQKIREHNADPNRKSVWGVTRFTDLTFEEFKNEFMGYHPAAVVPNAEVLNVAPVPNPPKKWDWREHGAVTPLKDQAHCGSCWAFSVVSEIESNVFMANGTLPILAPQQLVSCDKKDNGCHGGDPANAYPYIVNAGGLMLEKDMPYVSQNGTEGPCTFNPSKIAVRLSGFQWACPMCQGETDPDCTNTDEQALFNAVVSRGPVSICINANQAWQNYQPGEILSVDDCDGKAASLDHCVQLVGYNMEGATPYWIVRNQWKNWGNAGYIYLRMWQNTCGIADEATLANIRL